MEQMNISTSQCCLYMRLNNFKFYEVPRLLQETSNSQISWESKNCHPLPLTQQTTPTAETLLKWLETCEAEHNVCRQLDLASCLAHRIG